MPMSPLQVLGFIDCTNLNPNKGFSEDVLNGIAWYKEK